MCRPRPLFPRHDGHTGSVAVPARVVHRLSFPRRRSVTGVHMHDPCLVLDRSRSIYVFLPPALVFASFLSAECSRASRWVVDLATVSLFISVLHFGTAFQCGYTFTTLKPFPSRAECSNHPFLDIGQPWSLHHAQLNVLDARYNTFYILYPLGIASEAYLIYLALEPASEIRHEFSWTLKSVLLAYIPGMFTFHFTIIIGRRTASIPSVFIPPLLPHPHPEAP